MIRAGSHLRVGFGPRGRARGWAPQPIPAPAPCHLDSPDDPRPADLTDAVRSYEWDDTVLPALNLWDTSIDLDAELVVPTCLHLRRSLLGHDETLAVRA